MRGTRAIAASARKWFPVACLILLPLIACGPFFPEDLLSQGDMAVLESPIVNAYTEMRKVQPARAVACRAISPRESTWRRPLAIDMIGPDVAELRSILGDGSTALDHYASVRQRLANSQLRMGPREEPPLSAAEVESMSHVDGLPGEFGDYLAGLIALHEFDLDAATLWWTRLLDRPIEERQHRTLWATFMLGQLCIQRHDLDAAATWFAKTRELEAIKAFTDIDGFAAASLGLEARMELDRHHFTRAIDLYLQHQASGDPTATMSLMFAASDLLADDHDETLKTAAADEKTRDVVSVYLLSHAAGARGIIRFDASHDFSRWLAAIEAVDVHDERSAQQFAWIAYQANDYDAAQRWVDRAAADSPLANWLRAKLLLRAGNLDAAAQRLASVVQNLPGSDEVELFSPMSDRILYMDDQPSPAVKHATGELGVVQLARGQYTEALRLLMRAGYTDDAAYVAERVLSIDELKQFVNAVDRTSQFALPSKRAQYGKRVDTTRMIRDLLARRMMRAHRDTEARAYFDTQTIRWFDQYESQMARSADSSISPAERGRALAAAARTMRSHGQELVATYMEPDWEAMGGAYSSGLCGTHRSFRGTPPTIVPPTPDEKMRLERSPLPKFRWHYRYLAAELAWRAAAMLPDDSDDTAGILRDGGSWLKDRDPAAAEPFYRALITRCKNTSVGKRAITKGWLP